MQSPVALAGQSSGLTLVSPPPITTNIYHRCSNLQLRFQRRNSLILNSPSRRATLLQEQCRPLCARAESVGMITEKLGVRVERNPPESRLSELGVKQWPKWGCPPSNFPWTYSAKETCYLLKGKVKVTPEGANEAVEIQAGDLVVFPEGMKCTWDVSETVDKHYKFD